MEKLSTGVFVISLDFELFWGGADIFSIEEWKDKIKNVYKIVPRTLSLFEKYGIRATWATVAGVMLADEKELKKYLPSELPNQTREIISKFNFDDQQKHIPSYMLFGSSLVDMIKECPGQEIGTHTFTHFYCDMAESKPEEFLYELNTASKIMAEKGYGKCESIVFPRNQVISEFVDVIPHGFKAYRGCIPGYINGLKKTHKWLGTIVWYLDHYFPLQDSTYSLDSINDGKKLYNIRLSRLFKAYKKELSIIEPLKIRRYKREILNAAKSKKIYHLCWHPHNFSCYMEKNFEQLEDLLSYYAEIRDRYGMVSVNMRDLCEKV